MTLGTIRPDQLPYLGHRPTDGRVIVAHPYYDDAGRWHAYISSNEGTLIDVRPVRAVATAYISKAPADPRLDIFVPLSNVVTQHFSFSDTLGVVNDIERDYLNAFAVLHKYFILLQHAIHRKSLHANMLVSTELEFALSNHRAFYDLLNKLFLTLYSKFLIQDSTGRPVKPSHLPDTFHKIVEKTSRDLAEKFHFPLPLIEFYKGKADVFLRLRKIRDNIVHHGHSPQFVFTVDDGFAVSLDDRMWRELEGLDIWPDNLLKPNRLGSILGILVFLLRDMESATLGLANALLKSFVDPPSELIPGYKVFLRDHLLVHHNRLSEYRNTQWCNADHVLDECEKCWVGLDPPLSP